MEKNGRTIAIIGTPLLHACPRENRELLRRIAKHFPIISQVPVRRYESPDCRRNRLFFPERNVAMSALTEATIIVEAGETSGTLSTARAALAQGRKLFVHDSRFHNRRLTWPPKLGGKEAIRVKDYDEIQRHLSATPQQLIDELMWPDHCYLAESGFYCFIGECTALEGPCLQRHQQLDPELQEGDGPAGATEMAPQGRGDLKCRNRLRKSPWSRGTRSLDLRADSAVEGKDGPALRRSSDADAPLRIRPRPPLNIREHYPPDPEQGRRAQPGRRPRRQRDLKHSIKSTRR